MALTIAKRALRHAVTVVDFGEGLSFLKDSAKFGLLVIKVAKSRIRVKRLFCWRAPLLVELSFRIYLC